MRTSKKSTNKDVERFPCGQCGAVLKYAPGTTHLLCDYCGFDNPIARRGGMIEEYDLQQALRDLTQPRSEAPKSQIHCDECGAAFQFASNQHAGECPFCGTPIISTTAQIKPIQPKSLLPFRIDESEARRQFQRWLNGLWFAPNAVKKYARGESKLAGVYLPYWTFDSQTDSTYSGERGDVYYVDQPVQVMRNNRGVTEIRRVPKIHWTPVRGHVSRFFDDVLVGASNSLPRKILDALQPWDLENLVPYDANYLSGFRSEFYQVDLDEGFDVARQVMDGVIYRDIAFDIGGDHQRIHQVQTRHSDTTYKHCLLPVWSAAFRYRNKTYRYIVNGRTGEVQGERPYSGWKIAFASLAALLLAAGVYYYLEKTGALQNGQPHYEPSAPYYDAPSYFYVE
ncbi:primosomal protein N' (replication factor Y) - superfamily II helicase [Methylomarinum sp. Ch1-1]|uniref:Primosomal protein N' (Replication factor Y) -superfamily II helicase n=1 Tax=Methylomarinum roseum TaxID=3067653 RepID=A0AAU7NWH3_9GAMM|nr:primosomal protein N' (replication factor Y) - superfamily II helicase [Methylomarinum sp. Ch1-1]MDP4522638.1 primosomal protein N' (replication factor Y) - superfamily II helicase [Methylomarinum sp. Ch1-1]